MSQAEQTKNHFVLNKGLNTESNEVSFPDGYTTEEQNYELLVDGSRRRRKGVAQETGGSGKTVATIAATAVHTSFVWRGVDGDPSKNFIVHQIGPNLYFTDDADTISTTYHSENIGLGAYLVDPTTTSATYGAEPCQFDNGRGRLFVSNKYCKPFYVEWDSATDSFAPTSIPLRVRDFDGIDDGIPVQAIPSVTTADHTYNLRNQGWTNADIALYTTGAGGTIVPSKHIPWFKGYRRQTNVSYSDLDGIQVFDYAKIIKEQSGTSLAPMGSLLLDPLDTTYSANTEDGGVEVDISTWAITAGSVPAGGTIRVTAPSHGRINNDVVTIAGQSSIWTVTIILNINYHWDFNGSYTITVDGTDPTNTFLITFPPTAVSAGSFTNQYEVKGVVSGNPALPNSEGEALTVGPSAIAYHGARVWYAGIASKEYADTVFFSKIAQKVQSYGKCYQEADPTNPEYNALSSSDGGTIVIPNLGNVQRMLTLGSSLLVFTDQGVWEIGGGSRGTFTATGYDVRKITNSDCGASLSPLVIGNRAIYTGPQGIHAIGPNQFTGVLEETNMSQQLLESFWNAIPAASQARVQTVLDTSRNRVYLLYGNADISANQFANALVLDLKVGAFYKFAFNTSATVGLLSAVAVTESDSSNSNKKIKWMSHTSATVITTCDMDQTDYIDFDGAESPLPYMLTGWDNIGDFQRRRQAPVITVFAKRTETGYTETGNGYDPVNESSNLLTAYWDWTDDSVSGKIGSQNETYRHVRGFAPSGPTDVDGYPVVITRNKVRGRGRALQLRFDGAATKDSHILGFSTNYKIARKI